MNRKLNNVMNSIFIPITFNIYNSSEFWYRHIGHINFKILKYMRNLHVIPTSAIDKNKSYHICLQVT